VQQNVLGRFASIYQVSFKKGFQASVAGTFCPKFSSPLSKWEEVAQQDNQHY